MLWKFWKKQEAELPAEIEKVEKIAKELGFPDLSEVGEASDEAINNILGTAIQLKAPVPSSATGTSMDSAISGLIPAQSNGQINQRTLAYYIASSSFIGYFPCALMAQHWLIAKGCSLKAREAVKKWFTINSSDGEPLTPQQIKFIEQKDKQYKLRENLIQSEHFNNVFGIRHILFKHRNPDFDYSLPFNKDSFGPGDYLGISQIDPYWITPELNDSDLTDPTRIGFYEPTYWNIQGRRYHKSHFVILTGDEIPDYLKPSYRYGGISLVQKVYERVYASEATANEAPQLAKTKRLLIRKVDASEVQSNIRKFISNLNAFQKMRDNYGSLFIGKNDEVTQIDTALTDLDTTIMTQYQLVCSAFDVPASKLLGTGHGGFSTGETDDDYNIQSIEEIQGNNMTAIIEAHYERLSQSALIPNGINSMIEPVWNPLKVMSQNEKADILTKVSTALVNLRGTGAIDEVDIQDYLIKQKDLGFEGIGERENESVSESDFMEDNIPADQALNGAQVTALTGIIDKVGSGEMTKDTGVKVMTTAFPMSDEQARSILSEVKDGSDSNLAQDELH